MNVRGRMRVIIISITSECQTLGTSWGLGLRAWVERCSQGGNRFSGKGQACVRSAADHIQPPELLAFILGNNAEFYYPQERRQRNRSLMLWILHRLGPSVRLNWVTGGGSAGGSVQPWTNMYTYLCEFHSFQCALWKEGAPGEMWGWSQSGWDNYFWNAGTFPSNHCDFSLHASCKVDITALPGIWLPGIGACEGLSCIKHPQLRLDCCKPDFSQQRFKGELRVDTQWRGFWLDQFEKNVTFHFFLGGARPCSRWCEWVYIH